MKIKIGNKIYDGEKELIAVYLTDADKKNIKDMHPDCSVYSQFPKEKYPVDEVIEYLDRFKAEATGRELVEPPELLEKT